MNALPALLKLESKPQNHWVGIQTIGVKSNRSGIGARVVCVTGKHRQIDEVRSGGSYLSQSDLRLHFGLGTAARADLIEVYWPSGIVDRLRNVPVDRVVRIKEGSGEVSP